MDLTNLVLTAVQSVALVTNVVTGDNSPTRTEPIPCPDGMIGCLVYHSKQVPTGEPPTEKWVATNVVGVFTLRFDWMGQERVEQHAVPVWGVTNWYKLKQEWEKADPPKRGVFINGVQAITLGTNITAYDDSRGVIMVAPLTLTNSPIIDNGGSKP